MFNLDNLLMLAASLFLLVINWLAFHDFREPNTARDWLMLVATILVLLKFAREFWKQHFRKACGKTIFASHSQNRLHSA